MTNTCFASGITIKPAFHDILNSSLLSYYGPLHYSCTVNQPKTCMYSNAEVKIFGTYTMQENYLFSVKMWIVFLFSSLSTQGKTCYSHIKCQEINMCSSPTRNNTPTSYWPIQKYRHTYWKWRQHIEKAETVLQL